MQLQSGSLLQGGKYRIVRTIGQGGFGITYEAEQLNLERIVAIKEFFMKDCCERQRGSSNVIVPTQNNMDLVNKFRGKFIREAKLIASFTHNGIVNILDIFEENETAYYVMPSLPGGSLMDKVKNDGPLPETEALAYIRQVADALAYIHSNNTVHLDIKPANILLNHKGEAVLIDFGISKHYDEAGDQTTTSPICYSPGYSPIEQGRFGDVKQFTPSTDIYSLGATLFTLVTGKIPPEATIINDEGLPDFSTISPNIWGTIEASMKPRRNERPQSIKEFLELLVNESTVIVHNGRQSKQKDSIQQVYEEYYLTGKDNVIIKKNPIDSLFLHTKSNPQTGDKECWYEINGNRCTENLKSAHIGAEVFLLYANKTFFYAITRDYLKTEKLQKWDIIFRDSGHEIWECGDSAYFEYWYPRDFSLERGPYKWSGCDYPNHGIKYLIIRESDSLHKLVVIYDDHADLLYLHIHRYTGVKHLLSAYLGEIIASIKSSISR